MIKKIFFSLFVLVYFSSVSYSQIADSTQSIQPDLQLKKEVKVKKHKTKWPDPKKAILFAIIPGSGQLYNRRIWKLPFVYGALGTSIYFIVTNRTEYLRYKTALNLERQGLPHEFSDLSGFTETVLKGRRDILNKNMQQSYLVTIAFYFLQATEAFVDAHLRDFDVSEDLSFKIAPTIEFTALQSQAILGLSLTIPISR